MLCWIWRLFGLVEVETYLFWMFWKQAVSFFNTDAKSDDPVLIALHSGSLVLVLPAYFNDWVVNNVQGYTFTTTGVGGSDCKTSLKDHKTVFHVQDVFGVGIAKKHLIPNLYINCTDMRQDLKLTVSSLFTGQPSHCWCLTATCVRASIPCFTSKMVFAPE